MLIHFNRKCLLYVDINVSKKFNFKTHVYHSTDSLSMLEVFKQKLQQLILFLSRMLTDAEIRY